MRGGETKWKMTQIKVFKTTSFYSACIEWNQNLPLDKNFTWALILSGSVYSIELPIFSVKPSLH